MGVLFMKRHMWLGALMTLMVSSFSTAFATTAPVLQKSPSFTGILAAAPLTSNEMILLASDQAQTPGLLKESAGIAQGTRCESYTPEPRGCTSEAADVVWSALELGTSGWIVGWLVAGPSYPLYWAMWTGGGTILGGLWGWSDYNSMPTH